MAEIFWRRQIQFLGMSANPQFCYPISSQVQRPVPSPNHRGNLRLRLTVLLGHYTQKFNMVKKKVDSRIRTLVENGVKLRHRNLFVVVGKSAHTIMSVVSFSEFQMMSLTLLSALFRFRLSVFAPLRPCLYVSLRQSIQARRKLILSAYACPISNMRPSPQLST